MRFTHGIGKGRDRLITLRYSTSNGYSCTVFEDNRLIGRVRIKARTTRYKYLAMIHRKGAEDRSAKEFDTLYDALYWLEGRQDRSKGI